ncbi:sensor histidine kinase [Sphingomonas sp.]|uniref:sensor histidine kinase n=1 Tax=Sphingomonas sp. TaxID=28214 RepID=UPI0025F61AD9|nr:histidine kinase [Sphingomonas sp.]
MKSADGQRALPPPGEGGAVRAFALLLLFQALLHVMIFAINTLAMPDPMAQPLGTLVMLFVRSSLAWDELALIALELLIGMSIYAAMERMDERSLALRIAVGAAATVAAAALLALAAWGQIVWAGLPTRRPPHFTAMRTFVMALMPVALWTVTVIALLHGRALRRRDRMLAELRIATQAAEMRALRYQLNPHFLFNSLNSLSAMIWDRDLRGAEAMVLAFSDFLREVLSSDPAEDVPLYRELELQRKYLAIEEIRFADRLRVTITVEAGLEKMAVPNLILQPLIENSIKHGVGPSGRPVEVRIRARGVDGAVVLVVENGRDPEAEPRPGTGLGLQNVRHRLAVRFGEAATLATRETAARFVAELRLPPVPA